MNQKPATPRDAASVVLLNAAGDKILWARRNPQLVFLGGFQAFAGGKVDAGDAEIAVENCDDREAARFIACAVRETFEETGILLVRGGEKLTKGQRVSLRDDLVNNRFTFAEILAQWSLRIEAADFSDAGFFTTPAFLPIRFRTKFLVAVCPPKQLPHTVAGELENIEFIAPADALTAWRKSAVLVSPPTLLITKALANCAAWNDLNAPERLAKIAAALRENAENAAENIVHIEFNSRLICLPLKTETLPPATHTNCFIVGRRRFIVVDAATKETEEREKLYKIVDDLIENGAQCAAIITTHQHPDHFGGETALQTHLREKFNLEIPLAAHHLTAEKLTGKVVFQKTITDGDDFELLDENGAKFVLETIHTPGHAAGLLAFYDRETGFLLSGDNVISSSSVVVAPPDGNLKNYLRSLEKLRDLPGLRFLCGSHGTAVFGAKSKIEKYIAHRQERETQIIAALRDGAANVAEIVARVYPDLKPELVRLAEKTVEAHLEKINSD